MRVYTIFALESGVPHSSHPTEHAHQIVGLVAAGRTLWLPGEWPAHALTDRELPFPGEAEQAFVDYFRSVIEKEGRDGGNCHDFGAAFDGRAADVRGWRAGAEYACDVVAMGRLITSVAVGQHAVYGRRGEQPRAAHSVIGADETFVLQRDSVEGPFCLVPRDISDEMWGAAGYSLYADITAG